MKKIIVCFLFAFHSSFLMGAEITAARETGGTTGIGVAFSGPAGVSVYRRIDAPNFVQAALSFGRDGDFAVSGDYAFTGNIFGSSSFTPYWGIGALVMQESQDGLLYRRSRDLDVDNETSVGARIPLGANVVIPSTPIQLGGEIVPSLIATPVTQAFVSAGLHVRVLF